MIQDIIKSIIMLMVLSSIIFIANNCTSTSVGITTSNIPLEGKKFNVLGKAETSIGWVNVDLGIIGIPMKKPPIDQAIKRLLVQKGGDALINLRYSTDRIIIFFISYYRFHIKADVVKIIHDKK